MALALFGLAFVCFGVFGLWQRYHATHGVSKVKPTATISHSASKPDETPVDASTYAVPADQPRRIIIASAGIDGLIQKVAVDQHNAIAVPSNVHLAGWYTAGAKPGDQGLSIIDGHVQGYYTAGIFKTLDKVKAGDTVKVEYGNHSQRQFQVVDSKTVSNQQADTALYERLPDVQSQLTLITCGGMYDKSAGEYSSRIIVRTKSLDS